MVLWCFANGDTSGELMKCGKMTPSEDYLCFARRYATAYAEAGVCDGGKEGRAPDGFRLLTGCAAMVLALRALRQLQHGTYDTEVRLPSMV
jgi:hypothetical protein